MLMSRFAGFVIDHVVLYVVQFFGAYLGGFIAAVIVGGEGVPDRVLQDAVSSGMLLGWLFWGFAAWFLNYGILQGLTGSSLGKLACGTCVVNSAGATPGVMLSLARTVAYFVSALPIYLGFLAVFWTQNSRGFHDILCGTRVLKRTNGSTVLLLDEQRPEPVIEHDRAA